MGKRIGKVGKLSDYFLEEWSFWRLIKENPVFFVFQDSLSYPDIQELNAIMDMKADYDSAITAFQNANLDK